MAHYLSSISSVVQALFESLSDSWKMKKKEEKNLGRKMLAEDRFAAHLQFLRSGSFMDHLHEWEVDAMDPKTKPKF